MERISPRANSHCMVRSDKPSILAPSAGETARGFDIVEGEWLVHSEPPWLDRVWSRAGAARCRGEKLGLSTCEPLGDIITA